MIDFCYRHHSFHDSSCKGRRIWTLLIRAAQQPTAVPVAPLRSCSRRGRTPYRYQSELRLRCRTNFWEAFGNRRGPSFPSPPSILYGTVVPVGCALSYLDALRLVRYGIVLRSIRRCIFNEQCPWLLLLQPGAVIVFT